MTTLSVNKIIAWHGPVVEKRIIDSSDNFERVIGIANFQEPWFLKKGLERSRAIGVLPRYKGTGFLIANNIIMTNWHVLRRKEWAMNESIMFDFSKLQDGTSSNPEIFKLDPDIFFYSNEASDVAVVGVKGNPGKHRGYIDIRSSGFLIEDSRVNIIQHPGADFQKIAIRDNGIKYFDDSILQYWTDTEKGASGSPLFDDFWDIIGLHSKEDKALDSDGSTIYYNEGYNIVSILELIKKDKPEFLSIAYP